MHNLEGKEEKKKVFPKIKAAAQAAPAKKEVKDKTQCQNGSSQRSVAWLFNLVGQTERRHPCWKGLTATHTGQSGWGSRYFHAQQETPCPKAHWTPGVEVHAQRQQALSSFPSWRLWCSIFGLSEVFSLGGSSAPATSGHGAQRLLSHVLSMAVAVYMGLLWTWPSGKIHSYYARLHVGGSTIFMIASNTKGNSDTTIAWKILIGYSLFHWPSTFLCLSKLFLSLLAPRKPCHVAPYAATLAHREGWWVLGGSVWIWFFFYCKIIY